jgi:hypothetical protein
MPSFGLIYSLLSMMSDSTLNVKGQYKLIAIIGGDRHPPAGSEGTIGDF